MGGPEYTAEREYTIYNGWAMHEEKENGGTNGQA